MRKFLNDTAIDPVCEQYSSKGRSLWKTRVLKRLFRRTSRAVPLWQPGKIRPYPSSSPRVLLAQQDMRHAAMAHFERVRKSLQFEPGISPDSVTSPNPL